MTGLLENIHLQYPLLKYLCKHERTYKNLLDVVDISDGPVRRNCKEVVNKLRRRGISERLLG